MIWKNDKELFKLAKEELFTALVGDILDVKGYFHQFLPPDLKPLVETDMIIGRAMPVLEVDVFVDKFTGSQAEIMEKPFGLMFHALDDLKEDEVYIATGAHNSYAMWGGLMTTRALSLGAAGAIVDGYSRDTPEVKRLGFPCFGRGTYAQDQGQRGKVIDYRIPIEIGGVRINPGDIVFADLDGIVVVPKEIETEVFTKAFEKGRTEKNVLKAIQKGMSSVQAFEHFGVF